MEKIILIGGGGHCKSVIDAIESGKEFEIYGIADVSARAGADLAGYPVIGGDDALQAVLAAGIKYCFISIGSVGKPDKRIAAYKNARRLGFLIPTIRHASAVVSPRASLGEGNFIGAGAVVNAGAAIGNNCIINTGAIVEHDCVIGDNSHLATGAVLSGGVVVGESSHIGSGACVRQYIMIGSRTIIGTGSNVVSCIGDDAVAYGNPCRIARENA